MIRREIVKLIKQAAEAAGFMVPEVIKVDYPEDENHGDYATNFALQTAKTIKLTPKEIANNLRPHILNLQPDLFEKIEVADPGFLNFFISKEYLQKQVREILKRKDKYGDLKTGQGKKVNVEFICANPTGELHIGHGRGAFFGDTLANILAKAGFETSREHYANDAKNSSQIKALGETALGRGTTYLNEYLEKKIKGLKLELDKCRNEREAGSLLAGEVQKDIKNFIEKELKIKFDHWVSEEKDLYQTGKVDKIYKWLKNKNLIYEKDGAKWLKTSEYGDDKDWVLVRETGAFTYLLPDIAYHKDRFDKKYDRIINIWGADHQGHVSKIKAVAKILGYQRDLVFLVSQVVRLKGEKMSKRKGKVVVLNWLIKEAGLDAARFLYLMKALDTHMEFDMALAKEQSENNPVYYVQYAHARICSILRKAKLGEVRSRSDLLNHPSELSLIKQLIRFSEIIEDIAKDYQVQRLPQYAIDLATVFHQFYRDCKVLGSEAEGLRAARLSLVLATQIVLKNTLSLMGISAPEKM